MGKLEYMNQQLMDKKVFIGFDGYTDFLYSIVKEENDGKKKVFHCSEDFVENLKNTVGMSSEYEIILKEERIGGNAPIMSIGMASMGANVFCVGLFDKQVKELEEEVQKRLNIFSLGEPALSIALEFQDCKYMLADCKNLESITYENFKEIVGEHIVRKNILGAELIAVVNWSAVPALTEIIEHIFREEMYESKEVPKWLYLDLSDLRARDIKKLERYFDVIQEIKKHTGRQTCLSVNQNELTILEQRYQIRGEEKQRLNKLRQTIGVDEIIFHGLKEAIFCSESVCVKEGKNICENPKITTGAGDNFNAGVCIGKLLELSPIEQMKMGNKAAEFYVTYGYSAKLQDLIS